MYFQCFAITATTTRNKKDIYKSKCVKKQTQKSDKSEKKCSISYKYILNLCKCQCVI